MRPGLVPAVSVGFSLVLGGVASGVVSPDSHASARADGYGGHAGRYAPPAMRSHLRGRRFVEAQEATETGPSSQDLGSSGRTPTTVPDAGGTLSLLSLGLAAMAGIAWVRCRGEAERR